MKVAFVSTSPLAADAHLLNAFKFEAAFPLGTVLVQAADPATGAATVLELYEDDVATGVTVTLPAGDEAVELVSAHEVPAGAVARWRCVSAPAAAEDCASLVSLTMGEG